MPENRRNQRQRAYDKRPEQEGMKQMKKLLRRAGVAKAKVKVKK